jgi:hypothetical protein
MSLGGEAVRLALERGGGSGLGGERCTNSYGPPLNLFVSGVVNSPQRSLLRLLLAVLCMVVT